MLQRETGNERMKLVDILRANERFKRERRNSRTNRNRTTAFYRVFRPFLYVKKQRVQKIALPVVPRQFWWALLLIVVGGSVSTRGEKTETCAYKWRRAGSADEANNDNGVRRAIDDKTSGEEDTVRLPIADIVRTREGRGI